MAEALLCDALAKDAVLAISKMEVRSAGIRGLDGAAATAEAVAALARCGVDLREHKARRLTPELVVWADLLLVMETLQRERIVSSYPRAAPKTFLMTEFAGVSGEVSDPYGEPPEGYNQCADLLASLVPGILTRLREEAGRTQT